MAIRRAVEADAARLTALVQHSGAYRGRYASIVAGYEVSPEDISEDRVYLAADAAGGVLGFYALRLRPPGLDLMFVADEAQGRGIGRLLVDHMLAEAGDAGLSEVRVVSHPPAERFYLRVGAERVGTMPPIPPDVTWERPVLRFAVPEPPAEEPLTGGNVSAGVVRVGDTVRRPAGPWTPAVHALLDHLHRAGFSAAPRPLGLDEQGREVLGYAPGEPLWPDPERFAYLAPPERLARLGRLIRDFHDAVADFVPPPDARWRPLMAAPADEDGEIIAHHDLAPWNLVADGPDGAWVVIDWDTAGPGSRLWDLAYAAHGFVPLSAHPDWRLPDADAASRLRVLADAYGLSDAQRRRLVPLLTRRTRAMHDFLREQAAEGVEPWLTHWRTGHGDAWRNDAEYTERREELWLTALLG
ncbi:GNAT family N-acetyltransferase [Streptomyces sp. 4N509B]|uniref:GNAT family N-acetyltransferase n=1 Tax=Streptomyces sp. 4N509B TaxID=3457413 RepID=UPI003FD223D3